MKEIVVTKSFLGLSRNIKKCQHNEIYEDCTSKLFYKMLKDTCNCTLYALRNFSGLYQVCANHAQSLICNIFFIFQHTCSTKRDKACVQKIRKNDKNGCENSCEGIFADVKRLPPELTRKEMSNMIPYDQYQIYKRFFQASSGNE